MLAIEATVAWVEYTVAFSEISEKIAVTLDDIVLGAKIVLMLSFDMLELFVKCFVMVLEMVFTLLFINVECML